VIDKELEDLDLDHYLLHQRLVDRKMELALKFKKSSMKVSIIVRKDWVQVPTAMKVQKFVSAIMLFK
jgi:hypothetical protein